MVTAWIIFMTTASCLFPTFNRRIGNPISVHQLMPVYSATAPHIFSHPISHRTPHYRVGNGGIRRVVINQKRLNFRMKRNRTIQDNMAGNGLGNRLRWS